MGLSRGMTMAQPAASQFSNQMLPYQQGLGSMRSTFNQQLMQIPGFADSLQASQQRMTKDPNANMMRTQPALPAGYDPNIHKPSIGFLPGFEPASGPSTIPSGMQGDQLRAQPAIMPPPGQRLAGQEYSAGLPGVTLAQAMEQRQARQLLPQPDRALQPQLSQTPSQIPAGMQGDQLRAQQPLASSTSYGRVSDSMRQMPIGGFGQPDQAFMQAQIDDLARRRADPATMQMQMLADELQGRRQAPPNQPPNPFAGMSISQQQAMNEQITGMSIPQRLAMNEQINRAAQEAQMNERMRQQNMMRTHPAQRQADPYGGMRSIGLPVGQPQMPRIQPMPQPMPQPRMPQQRMPQQNLSPAFQYAAQNYNRLGGMQRTMDRPMEMMSVAERQRINQMAQGMAGMQRPTQSFGKGMQRPTTSSGKGGASPALASAIFGSGIGSLYGSGRAMF